MSLSIIPACLAALGAPADGGVPGLVSRTTLERFELLQTPGFWGHDPADNSYWRLAGGSAPLPAASARLLATIEDVIAGAEGDYRRVEADRAIDDFAQRVIRHIFAEEGLGNGKADFLKAH